jgi:hypothetical protein
MERTTSSRSHHALQMSRDPSQNGSSNSHGSSGESSMANGFTREAGERWSSAAPPAFDNKRRTRALMTKSQMSELKRTWRKVSDSSIQVNDILV